MADMEQPVSTDSEIQETPEIVEEEVIDQSADEAETPESDEDDYDIGDDKYRIPKKLKDHLEELKAGNLRNEDYTKKTQSVAEQRRAFEAERQSFVEQQQFQQQHLDNIADIRAIDKGLEQYRRLDWDALSDNDPVQAQKLDRQMRNLETQRSQLVSAVETANARVAQERAQATTRTLGDARQVLTRDIRGYGTPEVMKSLSETAKAMGYQPEELANVNDPRAVKLLYEASQYRKLIAAQKEPKAEVKPITRVGGAATAEKNPSNMSDKEFATWRRQQIAKRIR